MIGLFDFDSFIYHSVYRIVDFKTIRKWFDEKRSREWMEKEIIILATNRVENMQDRLKESIEDCGIENLEIEYFLTDCKRSERKFRFPDYKAHRSYRPMDKWARKIRQAYITKFKNILEFEFDSPKVHISEFWEADDLIADRAKELGHGNYLIIHLDKDLLQIGGHFFNYQRVKVGNGALDEYGNPLKDYKGLDYVSPLESERLLWKQVLSGDAGDNIKGLPGVGPKTAEKLIRGVKNDELENLVKSQYDLKFGDQGKFEYEKNYFLIKLGSRDSIQKQSK